MKILCIGQSTYDITLPMKEYPVENKKYKISDTCGCGGGSSNNTAYLLALWGKDAMLASPIGDDLYGKRVIDELNKVGVDTSLFEIKKGLNTTTSYIICNRSNGSRTIITDKSPLMKLSEDKVIDVHPDLIVVDGNDCEIAMDVIKKNPDAITIIDAGSMREGTVELAKLCDYVVCSNDFARDYSKIDFKCNEVEKLKKVYDILEHDFGGKVVITLESFGSMTKINGQYITVPSIKVESVDSTGAGDIYHGAFAFFVSEGYSLLETLYYSNIAGALSVSKIGSKASMPKCEEVLNYHEL